MEIKKYIRLWWFFTLVTTKVAFQSRFGAIVFLLGKMLRISFFLLFLVVLVSKNERLAGYSLWQVIFFFATFNLIDTLPQFLWREVYRFRSYVVRGFFDYIITKPVSPLFRSLFGGSDILDLFILIISIGFVVYSAGKLDALTVGGVISFIILAVNAFIIALSFHIFVLAIGILTSKVDNAILLYRDLTQMGRLPVDIYREPLRGFITFVIPIGIMMTFPAKAMMGLLSVNMLVIAFITGIVLFILSLFFWRHALRQYASVSS